MTGYAKYAGNRYNSGGQGGVSTVFNFFANDEEDSFSLVDNAPAPRQRYGARRFQNRNFQRRNWNNNIIEGGDMGKGAERERARQQRMQSKKQQQWNTWAHNRNRETITYSGSVDIRPDWDVAEQINLSQLTKLQASQTPPHEELVRRQRLAQRELVAAQLARRVGARQRARDGDVVGVGGRDADEGGLARGHRARAAA